MSAADSVARALGGRRNGRGYLCRCPVSNHGKGYGDRNPSLSIADGDDRLLVRCFAGCDARDILDELRRRGLLPGVGRYGRPAPGRNDREVGLRPAPRHEPNAAALALWKTGKPIAGNWAAAAYLKARGLVLEPPPSLRSGVAPYAGGIVLPIMIAAVQAPDRQVVAVQVTYLDCIRPRKAQLATPRWTIGALGEGAVRLAAATEHLGLAEGVEDALGAIQLTGVPTWACLGSARMHRVWVPSPVTTIHIFADDDEAGRKAVERAAAHHRAEGRRIAIRLPPVGIKDWADFAKIAPAGLEVAA
jgi:hypothetical protein